MFLHICNYAQLVRNTDKLMTYNNKQSTVSQSWWVRHKKTKSFTFLNIYSVKRYLDVNHKCYNLMQKSWNLITGLSLKWKKVRGFWGFQRQYQQNPFCFPWTYQVVKVSPSYDSLFFLITSNHIYNFWHVHPLVICSIQFKKVLIYEVGFKLTAWNYSLICMKISWGSVKITVCG